MTSWLDKDYTDIPPVQVKRKRGRPVGSRSEWRPKEEREADKLREGKQRGRTVPLDQSINEWAGPFVWRTNSPGLVRTAYWINCAYCGQLFARAVTWARSNSHRSSHNGNNLVCSRPCGRSLTSPPRFRVCVYCSTAFKVYAKNRHKRTCCDECMRSVLSENTKARAWAPLVTYAFEHGIEADYTALSCELCGRGQKVHGKTTEGRNTKHYFVRISLVNGKYIARCKYCYDASFREEKAKLDDMSAPDKLRVKEAAELISAFNKAKASE